MEIITNIEEVENCYKKYDGYKITTTKSTYEILIANSQSCCESWGYLSGDKSEFEYFIGAHFLSLERINTSPNLEDSIKKLDFHEECYCMFVELKTNRGPLQFAVYNAHNGYYGHNVLITKNGNTIVQDIL